MPIYEYACEACGKKRDVLHSINSTDEVKCECGAVMSKQLSAPNLSFGGGTWRNDWKQNNNKR
jgi:putative FmdB family regulatory protein